jgi:hypothetical protein
MLEDDIEPSIHWGEFNAVEGGCANEGEMW